MAYKWYGDCLDCTGSFLDIDVMEKWKDYCPVIQITDLESAIGFKGAYMIEKGTICISDDDTKLKNALDTMGYTLEVEGKSPLLLAESFLAHQGIEIDIFNGLVTIQTLSEGEMEFNGWTADKKLSNTTLKNYIESVYNVKFR